MTESRIPPHVAWPGFIILLFVLGAAATLSMVWIANSDGGVQVVDNYYEKAVAWDSTASHRASSLSRDWKTSVTVGLPVEGSDRRLLIAIADSAGQPVSGLTGMVSLSRPQYAKPVGRMEFREESDAAGTYYVDVPGLRRGLWDVEIEARLDTLSFWSSTRTEVY